MSISIEFRWLGVAGIEFTFDDNVLAVDPFFTRPPMRALWLGRIQPDRRLVVQKIPRCQTILVSHSHYDHLMDVPAVMDHTEAVALGSENTCRLLRLLGAQENQIQRITTGDRIMTGSFQVEVYPSEHIRLPGFSPGPLRENLHPPLRLRDYRMDACFCFLIQIAGLRLLIWTSERFEAAPPADVLFLGLTRQKGYTAALLSRVQPRLVIPIHWDDIFRPLSKPVRPFFEPPRLTFPPLRRMDLEKFRRIIQEVAPGTKVLISEIFRPYQVEHLLSNPI